tara:strand:- start:1040 stop:1525 length:486 start_codon:yes stop_codon:yes gene_type:complete
MHDKNNNKTQSYIQGLRPFASSIPKKLKKHLKKGGYNYSNIVDNWTKMVSKKISDACYPNSVRMGKEMKNGVLILNVIHGKELEVEYEKNQIIDQINSFFGYNCISNVTLKIVQDKIIKKNNLLPKIKYYNKIEEKMKKVKDEKLKNSLSSLLKAYNEKYK